MAASPDPNAPKLVHSVDEIAQALGVCRVTVMKEINSGRLHARRIATRIIVPAEDFAAYLAALPRVAAA